MSESSRYLMILGFTCVLSIQYQRRSKNVALLSNLTIQTIYISAWHWGAFFQPYLQWKSNEYYILWLRVCSLRYSARNAHAPCWHLWPDRLHDIFPHYLINGTIFSKKLLETERVLWFPLQILSETFLILRRTERHMLKIVYWSSCKVLLFVSEFNETWIFLTIFRKILNYQISIKSVQLYHTDGRTDMTKLFL